MTRPPPDVPGADDRATRADDSQIAAATASTVHDDSAGGAAGARAAGSVDGAGAAAAAADPLIGAAIGRYRVLAQLGAGAMGVVYRAHDPVLDRTVALKVLPPLDDARRAMLETRLRREAQALARLDHHNVLAVYDVGIARTSLFVAMQFVDGTTLDHAIAEQQLPPRRVLALYVAAGRGLAAAHAAGIIHRDVKPSNILVDRGGRVYVGDFGLARGERDDTAPGGEAADAADATGSGGPGSGPASSGPLLAPGITRAGTILGTPLYMSPEQHRGEPTTARSDQFSFCVALWCDALGGHPFAAGRWQPDTALAAMDRDHLVDPVRPRLPARAIRALRRGLRRDPAARWPSMTALLAELDPPGRSPWLAGGALAAVAAAALGFAWFAQRGDDCASAVDPLDRIATPARWRALADGFAATRLPYAADTAAGVLGAIDRYDRAWAGLRIEACRADRVRHEPVFDRRAACLDHRLTALDAALTQLAAPTAEVVDRAVDIVAALPPIEDCSDLARLAAAPAEPDDPALRSRIAAIGAELERQRARLAAGTLVGAVAGAEAVVGDARAAGWGPLLGQALHHAADAHQAVHEIDLAIDRMREASVEAGRARDDAAAADALIRVAHLLADRGAPAEALAVVADAEVLVLRTGDAARLRGRLEATRGVALGRASRPAEAGAAFRRAIELTRRSGAIDDELDAAAILSDEAAMLKDAAQPRPARDALLEAQRILEARLGAGHPRLVAVHATLGGVLLQLGDFPAARREYEAAGAIVAARFPADSAALAKQQANLALLELRQGHLDTALAAYRDVHTKLAATQPDQPETYQALYMIGAIQIEQAHYDDALATMQTVLAYRESHLGAAATATADVLDGISTVYQARDDYPHALEARKRGLAIREKALGPDSPDIVLSLDSLAFMALDTGDCTSATGYARRVLDIVDRSHSADHLKINALDTLGACAQRAGKLADARAVLEQALGYAEVEGNGRVEQRATLRIDLAEVLWKAGDRAAARHRIEEALAIYDRAGNTAGAAEQRKWLAEHRM